MSMSPDEIKAFAQEIAQKLGETKENPIQQIEQIVEHMGRDFVEAHIEKTEKIEADGGLKTEDGKRRRTKGGVFFYIIKGQMPAEIRTQIFPGFQGTKGRVVEWEEREAFVRPLLDEEAQGAMRYVTITLHGRPGKVVVEEDSIITTIAHQHKRNPMPRGVPQPPDEATIYTVYMSHKHWDPVKESIEKYKADRLIVEGTCVLDNATGTIAVFASSVTTRRLEKEARRESREDQGESPAPAQPAPPPPPLISTPPPTNEVTVELPGATPEDLQKLQQLHNAAQTLRDRIAGMEAKGQAGVSMTRKLLKNTEKQIEALEKKYAQS